MNNYVSTRHQETTPCPDRAQARRASQRVQGSRSHAIEAVDIAGSPITHQNQETPGDSTCLYLIRG